MHAGGSASLLAGSVDLVNAISSGKNSQKLHPLTAPLTKQKLTAREMAPNELKYNCSLFSESNPILDHMQCNISRDGSNGTANASSNGENSMYGNVPLCVLLSMFAMVTVFGNLLVIVAVCRESYLRTVTNFFIVSLAISDLIIGAVVMPFSITLEMTNQYWLFGYDWCDVWHSFDVLASTASILNLSVISLDRYWAITDPIAYPSKMSTARALVLIALVWICSSLISFPAILWWRSVQSSLIPEHVCNFTEDGAYLIVSSFISFYCPILIIMFAYYKIYQAATEQMRSLKTGSKITANCSDGEMMTLRIHRGRKRRQDDVRYTRAANSDSENDSPAHLIRINDSEESPNYVRPNHMVNSKWKHFAFHKKLSKFAKERKAAQTLAIVMGVFCVSWVPFFVSNILYGICHTDCVKHAAIVFPVFTWLGYINSGMNPIIYACSMRDFRRAFMKILFCGRSSYRRRYRYEQTFTNTNSTIGAGITM